jgi:DNA-binding MarR family transcriptional regulator
MQTARRRVGRDEALDAVATTLLARASRLSRLLLRTGPREFTRTEVGLLSTLAEGRRSIGELGETEALAQPSVSKLVDKLEAQGLVTRQRDVQDGRVVLVSISAEGKARIRQLRTHTHSVLRDALDDLTDDDLATLVSAGGVLEQLIARLRTDSMRR